MKKIFKIGLPAALSLLTVVGLAGCNKEKPEEVIPNAVYVAPDGLSTNDGTKNSPLDFYTATVIAEAGTTFLLKEGVYTSDERLALSSNGAPGEYITIRPEKEGDRVVFDFSSMIFDSANRGIQIYGDYWYIHDIEVTGAGDNGLYIAGNHNIIEDCLFYNNRDTGLQIGRGYSNEVNISDWPSFNLVKNCTSFANYDGETLGENADGFAAKLTIGYGNIFDGCVAFRNSDDGWDLYAKEDSGNIGTVMLYNCVSFENGFLPYTINKTNADGTVSKTYNTINGDGIGFKLGGSIMEGDVILENCMAFNNKLHGFGDNSNPGVIDIRNCTAFNNCIGLNADGTVSDVRGISGSANKSNNIDLARTIASYNNYYGVLSYINNQEGFDPSVSESSYNADSYRGSAAYSIFQTNYSSGEVYKAYGSYEDASSYAADVNFSDGTNFEGLSDESFASVESLNATCTDANDIQSLSKFHTQLRNEDMSVNMGNTLKVVDETLLTYCEGNQIGANLAKNSYNEYTHYGTPSLMYGDTQDAINVKSAYSVTEVLTSSGSVFQNFELPKSISDCEITWSSSNENLVSIGKEEKIGASGTIFVTAKVISPEQDSKVTLTATIQSGGVKAVKSFDLTVKTRNRSVGQLVSSGADVLRVNLYDKFVEPKITVTDGSSISGSELPLSLYDLSKSIKYTDDNGNTYVVDDIYTSVPGLYQVTSVASLKGANKSSSYTYSVYVVDPDCRMDFIVAPTIALTRDGFTVTGNLTNIDGSLHTLISDTELSGITADEVLANADSQVYKILDNKISAEFIADNNNVKDATTQYYAYYVVTNQNKSKLSQVYSFSVDILPVSTKEDFYTLATTGKLDTTTDNPTIYSLTTDLDFKDYEWAINAKTSCSAFSGLFNGNNKTIKNINIEGSSANEKTVTANVFYKISNGTIMNLYFDNIFISNTDYDGNSNYGKQVGIIGDLQGGYLHNIHITNMTSLGYESVGGLVGQATGGVNYITECSLINPIADSPLESPYQIGVYGGSGLEAKGNKYAGGIVGNAQMNSDQAELSLTINNCMVNAVIGNGKDANGNIGGILGRAKNETANYHITITQCYYKGYVIANGQYNAGILGDLDNGAGQITVKQNLSDVIFIYDGLILDAKEAFEEEKATGLEVQKYAHKNSNPIIGRATNSSGKYTTSNNIGSWQEYYSTLVSSNSIHFDYYSIDEETGEESFFIMTAALLTNTLGLDIENTWVYDAENQTIILKNAQ